MTLAPDDLKIQVMKIIRDKYFDFNVTHAKDMLAKHEAIKVSYSLLYSGSGFLKTLFFKGANLGPLKKVFFNLVSGTSKSLSSLKLNFFLRSYFEGFLGLRLPLYLARPEIPHIFNS